jgi:hypothetical protein
VRRQRQLDEDAVDLAVGVELSDERHQLGLRRRRRKLEVARLDAGLAGRLRLAAHVDRRGRIVADEHDRERRRDAAPAQCVRGDRDLASELRRDCFAVDELTDHEAPAAAFELLAPPPLVEPPLVEPPLVALELLPVELDELLLDELLSLDEDEALEPLELLSLDLDSGLVDE